MLVPDCPLTLFCCLWFNWPWQGPCSAPGLILATFPPVLRWQALWCDACFLSFVFTEWLPMADEDYFSCSQLNFDPPATFSEAGLCKWGPLGISWRRWCDLLFHCYFRLAHLLLAVLELLDGRLDVSLRFDVMPPIQSGLWSVLCLLSVKLMCKVTEARNLCFLLLVDSSFVLPFWSSIVVVHPSAPAPHPRLCQESFIIHLQAISVRLT